MSKNTQQSYKWSVKKTYYSFGYGMVILCVPMLVNAADLAQENEKAVFNSDFLIGDAKKVDIDRFKYSNPVLPGEYNVDVYINDTWHGKRRLTFKAPNPKDNATTCFTSNELMKFGVKTDILKSTVSDLNSDQCLKIESWVDGAFYNFDSSNLRMDISIPQVAMQINAQGYIDPSLWDRGINAAYLSYSANAYRGFSNLPGSRDNTQAFSSISAGANLAGWQFRHQGQWQWSEKAEDGKSKSNYDSVSAYAQRAFPKYRSQLTLGDSFTNGDVFDSFGFRGIDISSDDRMLPNSQLGYAPRIRGTATTNAKVEVHQQGQLIYQTTVAAGNFEINDLYPTGFGGDLNVSIIESNGEIQRFSVPYASVVQMLRPGMSRFSFTTGEFRDNQIDLKPWVTQAKYQRGLTNNFSAYGGIQTSQDYNAVSLGGAFSTPLGAVSLDMTHSEADFKNSSASGQSYRISYSKFIIPTSTNFTLAAYRYSTENFYQLRDAIAIRDYENRGYNTDQFGKQKSQFQITLNQNFPEKWGNIYITGSWSDYWNRSDRTKNYNIGYNNSYRNLSYGLSANRRILDNKLTQISDDDTLYMLSVSFSTNINKKRVNLRGSTTQDNLNLGISGSINDRLNYGASVSNTYGENTNFNANSQYRTNIATLGASYSYSEHYQQMMLGAQGTVMAHADGLVFGPDQGQTMVLVHAPAANGAAVGNTSGLTVNKSGYAMIPYVTPYRLNDIYLDPQKMSTDVELEETSQQVAPFAGAIVKANFATKQGQAIYIHSLTTEGKSLPFGASVYNADGENIGMIAQGSLVYLRSNQMKGELKVKWGNAENQQCQIHYDLSMQKLNKTKNMLMTDEVCQ